MIPTPAIGCISTVGQIGQASPRLNARKLMEGKGRYVDDYTPQRLLHACFVRSPHAHARIVSIALNAARSVPGVALAVTWQDIAEHCSPFVGVLRNLPGMVSAPQWPLARERALWQGEPVVMIVAASRAIAEDAAQAVEIEWEALTPLVDPIEALNDQSIRLHPELERGNLAYEARLDRGDVDGEFARARHVTTLQIRTKRVTAVSLEPRGVVADWDSSTGYLTVHMGTQVPYMMQGLFAAHLKIPESHVRVAATDVGGSFGLKIHVYGDEFAAVIASKLLKRPVKFIADRLESFSSDVHAREHRATVSMAVNTAGRITAFDVDDIMGIGPYSLYPRGSVNEARHVVNLVGAPYRYTAYRTRVRVAFQNKAMYGQYRGVGHPIACLFTELAVEHAARMLRIDPVEFRRRNLRPDNAYPDELPTGVKMEALSHERCLDQLMQMMDYPALRQEQAELRARGVHRGIGFATFVENSNHSSSTYGKGGAPIAATDGCTIKLLPDGSITCLASATDTGQGTSTALAQIVATVLGISYTKIKIRLGDTDITPHGGANWGSRGTGIVGEATWQAATALKNQVTAAAAHLWQCPANEVELRDGRFVNKQATLGSLSDLARAAYYRPDLFDAGFQPELMATRHYSQRQYDGVFTNGVQASLLELDSKTGAIHLLRHWIVDDCGIVINPLLVDEQLRGAVVQGIGQAIYEACLYNSDGQLLNATLAEYLVPMAREMPDIEVGHVCTRTNTSELGAKGAGEAGVTGALAAVLNAINDALAPFNAQITQTPVTPDLILRAIGALKD